MGAIPTIDTPKHHAPTGAIGFVGMAAPGAVLTRVGWVNLDHLTPLQMGFVGHNRLQFGKRPGRAPTIGAALFGTGMGRMSPFRAVTNMGQVLYPDQRLGMMFQDTCSNLLVRGALETVVSAAQGPQSAGCRTSAFALQSVSYPCIVVTPLLMAPPLTKTTCPAVSQVVATWRMPTSSPTTRCGFGSGRAIVNDTSR